MPEETLVLIKPDGIERRLVGEIIGRYERLGLDIRSIRLVHPDEQLLRRHYAEHVDKPFFPELMAFMLSGNTIAMILSGEDAIGKVRAINGSTDPKEASAGTIRGDLADDVRHNLVHGSDGPDSAAREIAIWFSR